MIDTSQLSLVDVILLTFGAAAIAATQLRERGLLGWISIVAIFAISIGVVVSLDGLKQVSGFVSALAGLAVGGKFSDWRELIRAKETKEAERRDRDARFK